MNTTGQRRILCLNIVIETPPVVALPVAGTDAKFPVRRVYCIGRNYAAHAIEMGHDPDREPPFFFQKNPNNLDPSGEFPYPPHTSDVHHEAEVAVMLKSGGTNIRGRPGAGPCLRLCAVARHDPPRPAGRDEEDGPPVGNRQGVRTLGPRRPGASGLRDRASRSRRASR